MVYDPTHPDANEDGYVERPNVDILKETIDSMAASRAYDARLQKGIPFRNNPDLSAVLHLLR